MAPEVADPEADPGAVRAEGQEAQVVEEATPAVQTRTTPTTAAVIAAVEAKAAQEARAAQARMATQVRRAAARRAAQITTASRILLKEEPKQKGPVQLTRVTGKIKKA